MSKWPKSTFMSYDTCIRERR